VSCIEDAMINKLNAFPGASGDGTDRVGDEEGGVDLVGPAAQRGRGHPARAAVRVRQDQQQVCARASERLYIVRTQNVMLILLYIYNRQSIGLK
jgi:hypothetical protein